MRREKPLHVGGDSVYERFDPSGQSVDLVAVENTRCVNGEIERQSMQGVGGDYLRHAT